MGKIITAKNAGFCFGVKRAVDAVFGVIDKYEHIYTLGELIHNRIVINELEEKGVEVAQSVEDIKKRPSTLVIIRSHGVPKKIYEDIERSGFEILDLTCPFVKRIHDKVHSCDMENVIIVGKDDHPEVMGIKGWTDKRVFVCGSGDEARSIGALQSALVVAQTTITGELWEEVTGVLTRSVADVELFNSICDTTQKRQNEAEELSKASDTVLVIGGKNSSNTEKLYRLCKKNCPNTYYIENIGDIPLEKISKTDIISIVAGASTPDRIIREVFSLMTEVENMGTQQEIEEATPQEAVEAQAEVAQETAEETVETTQETVEEAAAAAAEETVQSQGAEAEEDDFAAQLEKTFVYIRKGQLISGSVVQISDSEICVNIGYKSDGIIKKENLSAKGDVSPLDVFKVGDTIEAEVLSLNDGEGNVVLSRKSIESKLKWKELVENLDPEKLYTVKIEKVVKGGVLTKLDGYDAFLPASQLSLKYVEDLNEFVDKDLEVVVLDVDKKQRRFVLSHKAILQKEADEKEKELYASFKKGDRITGKVKRLTDFGAFVDIGGVDGLLHITDISWVKVKHPSDVLQNGQEIEVLVLNVDSEKKRVSLGLKQLAPKPWDLAPEKYLVGSTVEGTVVRILPFGAFISLEPTIDGLVHISQITNRRLEKVEEMLRIGDRVQAKVMGVDSAKKRITLSMRALIPEESRPETKKESSREDNFRYEMPPVEDATTSLGDLFPNLNDSLKDDEE